MILWMRYRMVYFVISAAVLAVGIFGLFRWGLNLSIDFTGGMIAEYQLPNGEIKVEKYGIKSNEEIEKIRSDIKANNAKELRFEIVGPSIGPDLVKKTYYAVCLSAVLILFWVAVQFKSLKFGISAILATLHDTLVLIGLFSVFGYFWGVEIDFLFVTAVLTTLSFSVHDTIVVFDRIREKLKYSSEEDLEFIANQAVTETMVRSINNSLTIIFMLISLILLGGESIRWFAIALLVGTISGTYSSPFVAVPILVVWNKLEKKLKAF